MSGSVVFNFKDEETKNKIEMLNGQISVDLGCNIIKQKDITKEQIIEELERLNKNIELHEQIKRELYNGLIFYF